MIIAPKAGYFKCPKCGYTKYFSSDELYKDQVGMKQFCKKCSIRLKRVNSPNLKDIIFSAFS